jgi:hypothetical protein
MKDKTSKQNVSFFLVFFDLFNPSTRLHGFTLEKAETYKLSNCFINFVFSPLYWLLEGTRDRLLCLGITQT